LHGFFVLGHRHLQNAKRGRLEQNPSFSAKQTRNYSFGFCVFTTAENLFSRVNKNTRTNMCIRVVGLGICQGFPLWFTK
jgi:hypothetical protein